MSYMIQLENAYGVNARSNHHRAGHVHSTVAGRAMSGAVSGIGFSDLGSTDCRSWPDQAQLRYLDGTGQQWTGIQFLCRIGRHGAGRVGARPTNRQSPDRADQHRGRQRSGADHPNGDDANPGYRREFTGGDADPRWRLLRWNRHRGGQRAERSGHGGGFVGQSIQWRLRVRRAGYREPAGARSGSNHTSGFYTQINTAVSALTTNGAAATVATTLTIASSTTVGNSPFSATYLAQPASSLTPPSVATGAGQSQSLGLLASANIGPVSTGTSTTGSYMLDLMRALATVGSLSSSQASDPNFAAVVADTQTSVTGAISSMSTDVGILGEQQSSLTTLSTTFSDTQTALTGQLSSAQDVDMASTLSNLSLMQTQLQESYQLIAAVSGLSLAKFLPAA